MKLFFSTEGRIGRKQFWIGFVVLILIGVAFGFALAPLSLTGSAVVAVLTFLLGLILLYPAVALSMKRLRDRGRHNLAPWLLAYFVPGFLTNLSQTFGIGFERVQFGGVEASSPTLLGGALLAASFVAFLVAIIDLGFLKGRAA